MSLLTCCFVYLAEIRRYIGIYSGVYKVINKLIMANNHYSFRDWMFSMNA